MENKKLYYQLSDSADVSNVVMELSGVMSWIEGDMEGFNHETDEPRQYIIEPIWLTDEEFDNLPEASI